MSPKIKNITAMEFIKALEKDGFVLKRQKGSHRIYVKTENGRQVVLAYHHSGESLRTGTLSNLINDAGWTEDDLIRLKLIRKGN
jgi:predicted RNA binding protein YcfA (HicA-like mRNA interferase family)